MEDTVKYRAVTLFILIAFLLSACGQAAAPAPSSEASSQTQEQAATGKRILRVSHSFPGYVDPALDGSMLGMTLAVNVYDTLLRPTVDGGVEPWVAESYSVSDDGLTYTFKLNKGIKFHNGDELKAKDVVFSMKRLTTIGQGMAYLFTPYIENSVAIDDYTVEFTLNQPFALFPLTILRLFIVNEAQVTANIKTPGEYGEFGDFGKEFLLTNDAGSGAYKVKEVQLENYFLLEKNPDWWAKENFVSNSPDEVRIIPIPDPSSYRTLLSNRQLEIGDQWQSRESLEAAEQVDGVEIAVFDGLSQGNFYINTKMAPTDDIHFRKALTYAYDYETMALLDWPGTEPSGVPVPKNTPGYNTNLVPYEFDLEKAKDELAQSKYADELDKYPVKAVIVSDTPTEEKIALALQANLAKLGVTMEIEAIPWLTLQERISTMETTPNLTFVYMSVELPEAGFMLMQRFHSNNNGNFFQGEWLQDAKFDREIEAALQIQDNDERFKKVDELQQYIMDLYPTIFLYDQLMKHAYQSYVDWPVNEGVVYKVMGYNQWFPFIGVDNP